MKTRTFIWLSIMAWALTFTVLLSPTLLIRAEVMKKASTDQLIDAQTVAFQSAAPFLYVALGLSFCLLVSLAVDERHRRQKERADQAHRAQIQQRNREQMSQSS